MVNENTVRMICELLDLPGYDVMNTKLKDESDAELLLAFIVDVYFSMLVDAYFKLIPYFP
jgi:hypothetical protein